jgi:alcohol/geraniol dehydrogenase (NADP+)
MTDEQRPHMKTSPVTAGSETTCHAWVARAHKQPMTLETVDLGPIGPEDVEVAVKHCGLCHSDLSVLNNEWGISQYPAILGHEVVGRVTALGQNAKGIEIGQRVGVGWNSGSCMHCRQCMSGDHNLCAQAQVTIVGHRGGLRAFQTGG